jgi:MFS family permease
VSSSAFLLVVSAAWTINLTFTLIAPILPQIASHGGGHMAELAAELVMTIASLGIILGMISSGALQDWLGTRRIILGSLLLTGLAGSAGFVVHNLVLLGLSRAFLGFFGACSTAALTSLLAELYDDRSRGRVLGFQQATAGAFNIGGTLLGGFAATLLGWQSVFLLYGVFGVAAFILALRGASDVSQHAQKGQASLLAAALSSWPLLATGVGVLTLTVAPFTQGSFILAADGVTDSGARAIVITAGPIFVIVGAGFYGRLRTRLSALAITQWAAAIAALGVIVMGLAPTAVIVGMGIALTGLAGGLTLTSLLHQATEAPAHLRARAIGLVHAFCYLGVLLNPVVMAPLRSVFGLRGALETWGTLALIVTAIATVLSRSRRKVKLEAA